MVNMNIPLVSVVITTFNRMLLLENAIRSVLQQQNCMFELIIVDDGSTDDTKSIVESFNDGRIKYFANQENIGSVYSLNIGVTAAKGEYIAILDDDDMWCLTSKLERQLCFLSHNNDYALLGTNAFIVNDITMKVLSKTQFPSDDKSIRPRFLRDNPFVHSSIMFKKDDWFMVGGYDQSLARGKDFDLMLKLGLRGKVAILSDHAVVYREATSRNRNILKLRIIDSLVKLKIAWRYRNKYSGAISALRNELVRLPMFVLFNLIKTIYSSFRIRS